MTIACLESLANSISKVGRLLLGGGAVNNPAVASAGLLAAVP